MKYIEDMSDAEAYSWVTLLATTGIFFYFFQRMTDGFTVVEHSPSGLMTLFIGVIIFTIIAHIVIASIFTARRARGGDLIDEPTVKDERDIEIEHQGERHSSWFVYAAINVIIFTLLFEYTYPQDYKPPISVISPSNMFFALMATLFVGDIVKRLSMVLEYRK